MKNWYKIAKNDEEDIDQGEDLLYDSNWRQQNYEWNLMGYTIDSDTPTEQYDISFEGKYIGTEDTFEDAMQMAYDHFHGYIDTSEKKEVTPYDIIERKFGYTDNPLSAGYIMEDGAMVNLNRPHIDHRAVTVDGSTKSMQEFIADGNIRMSFVDGHLFLDIGEKPTSSQIRTLSKIIKETDSVEVKVSEGLGEYNDRNESYVDRNYEIKRFDNAPSSEAVLGDIRAFFEKDIYPSQFSRFLGSKHWRRII
jgi:hypothetical protein